MDNAQLLSYYPNGLPIVVRVAIEKGYGGPFLDLKSKVMNIPNEVLSPQLIEAIQVLCLSACENQYCTVMHCRGLIALGYSMADVRTLVEFQRLPADTPHRDVWENSLRRIAAAFRGPQIASTLYYSLEEFHTAKEIEAIASAVAFSMFHKFLLEAYTREIDIEAESLLFTAIDCGRELIDYLERTSKQCTNIVALCTICKDIRLETEWIPIERALHSLPADAQFSHAVCDRCVGRWQKM
ncbi:MAG: hypothetical protein K0U93_14205 [Gammaproteobacteria bacterium]|nr:hypothetical protein [Gammaproteobacteria bacterium]